MSFAENLAEKLVTEHDLSEEELLYLLEHRQEVAPYVQEEAQKLCQEVFGKEIYIRGLLEISNICKNDCYYCGIRKSNRKAERYRLTEEEILEACRAGYALGFRTFVLQGGEDMWYDDERLCHLVSAIRKNHPDCAITLSVGERSRESYEKLFAAGANRYLLRHETATVSHYAMLAGFEGNWLSGGLWLYGRLAPSDFGASGERPSVFEGISATYGRHWSFSFSEGYAFCPL